MSAQRASVYLSGATGFIGGRLAKRLLADGFSVRCLVRSVERAEELRQAGALLFAGDITDPAAVAAAMSGCDLAYQLAAIYELGVVDAAALERTNVAGTTVFLDAVRRTGVKKAVYVSTTVALGPSGVDESSAIDAYDGPYSSQYHRTKSKAHELARKAQNAGLPLIIACPSFVYGPGDEGPGGRFIRDLVKRRVPGLLTNPAWFSYVHVDDVVDGLFRIGERGLPGRVYILSGDADSVNGFARRVTALAKVRMPLLRFPPALAGLTGVLLDVVQRATGLRMPISREAVASTARDRWLHSHAPATQELGYRPRSLDEGLPDTVAWFRET